MIYLEYKTILRIVSHIPDEVRWQSASKILMLALGGYKILFLGGPVIGCGETRNHIGLIVCVARTSVNVRSLSLTLD